MIRRGAFRIAVDTGGTFTDVVISGESGHLAAGKSLTTPERVFDGFLAAVDRAAESLAIGADQVLRDAQVIVYGTTHATNAVITGATARTALLVTEGFADTLIFREGGRRNVFDTTAAYPLPYVPRRLTFEVPERLSAEGEVLVALDEARARAVLAGLADHAVEALAVMFLWSVVDPVHELRVGELIDELLPGLPYTLSHRANPVDPRVPARGGGFDRRVAQAADAPAPARPPRRPAGGRLRRRAHGRHLRGRRARRRERRRAPDPGRQLRPSMAPLAGASFAARRRGAWWSATWAAPPSTSRSSSTARSVTRATPGSASRSSASSPACPPSRSRASARAAAASPGSTPAGCCASARRAPAARPGPRPTGAAGARRRSPTPPSCSATSTPPPSRAASRSTPRPPRTPCCTTSPARSGCRWRRRPTPSSRSRRTRWRRRSGRRRSRRASIRAGR